MPNFVFGNDKHARGCYREIMGPYGALKGRGAYLTLNDTSYPRDETSDAADGGDGGTTDPYFITGISFTQKEKYHIVQCFNDRNYTYAFGHDPLASMIEVTFTMFITDAGGTSFGKSLKNMIKAYGESRLSKHPYYATLGVGAGVSLEGFVVGMTSSTLDPEHNLQSFTIVLLVVETQGKAGGGAGQ